MSLADRQHRYDRNQPKPKAKEETSSRWSCCGCNGELVDARLLPCLHSVCIKCRVAGTARDKDECFTCGTCAYIVGPRQMDTLQVDYLALDYVALQKLRNPHQSNNCGECIDAEIASHRCASCSQFLCTFHETAHRRSKATHDHKTIPLSQLQSSSAATADDGKVSVDIAELAVARSPLMCVHHKQKELELYCESCSQCICRDCVLVDHKLHAYMFIPNAIERMKMWQDVPQLDHMVTQFQATLTSIEWSKETLATNFLATSQNMEKAAIEAKRLVDVRLNELLSDVDRVYQKKSIALENQEIALKRLQENVMCASGFAKSMEECASPSQRLILNGFVDARLKSLLHASQKESSLAHDDGSLSAVLDLSDVKDSLKQFGCVTSTATSGESSLRLPTNCYTGQPVTATVNLADASGHPTSNINSGAISCTVSAPDGRVRKVICATVESSKAIFNFIPACGPGKYAVNATIAGLPAKASPAIANVSKPPWIFGHTSKSYTLRQSHGVKETGIQLSLTGLHAKFEDEEQAGRNQRRQGAWMAYGNQQYGTDAPQRLIAAAKAIPKTINGPAIKWHIKFEVHNVGNGEEISDPAIGVGLLVNEKSEAMKALVRSNTRNDFETYAGSAVTLFSSGNAMCGKATCYNPHRGGPNTDGGDAEPDFKFRNGDQLTLEYIPERDFLVVTQPHGNVKYVVDLLTPSKKVLPLDSDIDMAFKSRHLPEQYHNTLLSSEHVFEESDIHYSYAAGTQPSRSQQFGVISSICPAVWLSAKFSGDVHLSFPAD
ncbi:E3 ubiquitin-protein ligase TRIM71-like [Sycon ciliatum]|uniref:E3 ubiquitin-protein ligase TRIM71-like n=1 Tax=Sycon ciliatum TaxID=27933 RepID=UPI0031F6D3B3